MPKAQHIPNNYHFIWLGNPVPYFLVVAIQSVLVRCAGATVKLWTDEARLNDPLLDTFAGDNNFNVQLVEPEQLIDQLEDAPIRNKLRAIFNIAGTKTRHEDRKPIERSRSNLLRYLILYQQGGVYLDADTLVTQDLKPLREADRGFVGKENSIWAIIRRKNPLHYFIWAPFLEVFRMMATQLPFGYRWNKAYRLLCSSSLNNAVMGMTPRHPFLTACFQYILNMTDEEIVRPLRLGPFLLQRVEQQYTCNDLAIYPEPYFYPYGPLISQHYFKKRNNAAPVASYMLGSNNYVIHWCASTKTLKLYEKGTILRNGNQNVFSLLSSQVITAYEDQEH